jgi:uncharacterized protein
MEFRGMEAVVVDLLRTPELQRLRRIKQLGMADLVFPAAEHSRFSHSLGASYLAVRFGRQLQEATNQYFTPVLGIDESVVRDLAVAALCHDLGHGPLSHAWEREVVGTKFDRAKWCEKLGLDLESTSHMKWHELVGRSLLGWPEGHLHRLLESHESGSSTRIRELLGGRYYLPYLSRLLSSDLDVDRADFIKRDTHHTGVKYGRYDLDWLVSTATVGHLSPTDSRRWVLGFDSRKATRVVEQFLVARRALYETVYHHKTVRCAEGMMAIFLRRLKRTIRDGYSLTSSRLIAPLVRITSGEALEPAELLRLDDSLLNVVMDLVIGDTQCDETLRDIAQKIAARDLFKLVPVDSDQIVEFLASPDAREMLGDAIKPYCRGDSECYFHIDNASFSLMSQEPDQLIYFIEPGGQARPATEVRALNHLRTDASKLTRVYVPLEAVSAVQKMIKDRP